MTFPLFLALFVGLCPAQLRAPRPVASAAPRVSARLAAPAARPAALAAARPIARPAPGVLPAPRVAPIPDETTMKLLALWNHRDERGARKLPEGRVAFDNGRPESEQAGAVPASAQEPGPALTRAEPAARRQSPVRELRPIPSTPFIVGWIGASWAAIILAAPGGVLGVLGGLYAAMLGAVASMVFAHEVRAREQDWINRALTEKLPRTHDWIRLALFLGALGLSLSTMYLADPFLWFLALAGAFTLGAALFESLP